MKTFIINLERSVKRREHILEEVEKHKLDYEFIKGVDGRILSEGEVAELMDAEAARTNPATMTPGTLGCLLSHLSIYKKIVAENLEMAFVLEDDAVLPENINEILEDVACSIEKNEVVLLYFTSFTPCELSRRDAVEIRNGYQILYPVKVRQPVCATAYVISRGAARTLAELEIPMKMQCDEWGYFYENGGIEKFRVVYPVPVKTNYSKSEIQQFKQSGLRLKLTKFIDDNKIPILFKLLRYAKHSNVKGWSVVKLVDEPSPMLKTAD